MIIKIAIVDDEKLARDRLLRLLKEVPDVEVIGQAANGKEAVEIIRRKKPDLVILDVQMPEMDGFSVLRALDAPPHIIFLTAYDAYAIQAFEVQAVDYLLKPCSRERLAEAIQRVRNRIAQRIDWRGQLDEVMRKITGQKSEYLSRLSVTRRNEIFLLDVEAILYFEVDHGLAHAHTEEGKFTIKYSLNELDALLDPDRFFRANRMTIINLGKVQKMVRWFRGRIKVIMKNQMEIEVSRQQSKHLRAKLDL